MATIWVFEPQLDTIHPLHRLVGNFMCPGLKGYAAVNTAPRGDVRAGARGNRRRNTKSQALEMILASRTRNEVFSLVAPTGPLSSLRLGISVRNLLEPGGIPYQTYRDPTKRTMEFRQHESTLDHGGPHNGFDSVLACGNLLAQWKVESLKRIYDRKFTLLSPPSVLSRFSRS
jgi:hypothetical protein